MTVPLLAWHIHLSCSLCIWASNSTLLFPNILNLTLLPNFILFSYWLVNLFIKPVIVTYIHTVCRRIISQYLALKESMAGTQVSATQHMDIIREVQNGETLLTQPSKDGNRAEHLGCPVCD